ncbi:MAG: pilus assembly protein CpaB [Solirubrobacterales bacterium]|nr:pilus assembly protein CpaB [Solirubrobacterales bacterium]
MSRRGRAIGFASAAAICAGFAAGASGGVSGDAAAGYGELRDVVVATAALPAARPLGRTAVDEALEVRRIPERFLPPDALTTPAQALGRRPAATIPAGGYLLASQFRAPAADRSSASPQLGGNRHPVEITVQAAGPLAAGASPRPRRVDVVVTSEAGPAGGAGRTFVAAAAVELLDLRPTGGDPADAALPGSPGEPWIATLALTRAQALRLIHAQSFARELRLIER